jgi:squalene-associated FAD-dependent desaturase
MAHVHVIGAGLAGLSAAITSLRGGRGVTVYEAGPQAGGRCRSYDDPVIGCRIDNGNHLLLSGNRAAMAYCDIIGSRATLGGPGIAAFPFYDAADGARWEVRPGAGRAPWWLFDPARRVRGTKPWDYLALPRLAFPPRARTVGALLRPDALSRNLLAPLAIAALNTPLDEATAPLFAVILRQTLLAGGSACIPLYPRHSLAESLIDPALAWIGARGGSVHLSRRVTAIARTDSGRVSAIETGAGTVALGPADGVILAVPPAVAAALMPGLRGPDTFQAIVNLHFRAEPRNLPPAIARAGFVGIVGATSEWGFVKPGHVSVTISAANALLDQPADTLSAQVWPEISAALGITGPLPPSRVVKEKRATFAATAAQNARRPGARLGPNAALAGDWTATGLPATIEGAIRSGCSAAQALLA